MKHQAPPAAAASAFTPITPDDDVPTFEELIADPEIAALLDFAPVPRRNKKEGGWSADMQRMFIARLARHGSPTKACDELGMYRSGIDKVCKSVGAEAFRVAWAEAIALAERRRAERIGAGLASVAGIKMPSIDNRQTSASRARNQPGHRQQSGPLPGQVLNEFDEYEDQASFDARVEEVRDSIPNKLLRIRRIYLQEISDNMGKRAAFEILTELPIDWDKAGRGEAQDDEPWRNSNQRQPDMVLLAESGWSWGDCGYGPNRMAEARLAIDQHREEAGLPPVNWEDEHQG